MDMSFAKRKRVSYTPLSKSSLGWGKESPSRLFPKLMQMTRFEEIDDVARVGRHFETRCT